jgi:regulator of RNase E activity RraA
LADETSVIVIPATRIDEVFALAARIAAQELAIEARVLNDSLQSWDDV